MTRPGRFRGAVGRARHVTAYLASGSDSHVVASVWALLCTLALFDRSGSGVGVAVSSVLLLIFVHEYHPACKVLNWAGLPWPRVGRVVSRIRLR
jgi:hypothetical protein